MPAFLPSGLIQQQNALLNSVLSLIDGLLGGGGLLGTVSPLTGLSGLLGAPASSASQPVTADQIAALVQHAQPGASTSLTDACTYAVLNTMPLISGLR